MASDIYSLARQYDELNVAALDLDNLEDDKIEALHKLVSKKDDFKKYNKLAYWKPYPFQEEWIKASLTYRQRYLSAANRIGKTYGACMELAAHITGYYPPDWQGRKIKATGDYWCIGVSQESVNNVLMKELLGVSDCRNLTDLGTGAIPKECIDVWSMVKDGARCLKVRINHIDGSQNTLNFFASTQDESVFMGAAVHYILMDEQFKNESDLYAQCLTRTATTEGMISVTCTPEQGMSPLWTKFSSDDTGKLYFQSATWADAPHMTPEVIAELLAGYPAYQRDLRSKGIPVLGSGAVYPFSEEEINEAITIEDIKAKPYGYKLLWSCDFGYSSNDTADPSTLLLCAYDVEADKVYTVKEWNSKNDGKHNRLAHLPEHMASIIKASAFPYAPLLVPHDGKRQIEGTNSTRLSEFKRLGINVLPNVFEIPFQLTQGAIDKPKHSRSLHWTIQYLCKLFDEGKLKLDVNHLPETMKEFRLYQWKDNGEPVDKNNHHLDALRYNAVSIKFKGAYVNQCYGTKAPKWSTGRSINKAWENRRF